MIAAMPVARAAVSSTLKPLASRVPSHVDPASLRVVAPLFTIVSQKDRVVLPAPTLGPVIKGGGSGLPGAAAAAIDPSANSAINPAPAPATSAPIFSGGGGGGGGASSPTDDAPGGPSGYGSGAPSFSASSFTSPAFLVGAAAVIAGAIYLFTRRR